MRVLSDDAMVLGIETSCDDTATALYSRTAGVVAHKLGSQLDSHSDYGGVVPEIASRDHAGMLLGLVRDAVGERRVDAVACTAGPGLAGCLAAGVALAQSLAFAWRVPLALVNHLEGHLLSPFLEPCHNFNFPFLCLLLTGGHTALIDVAGVGEYQELGTTLDDACGEAFDKTGILLGLDFPGGARLEQLAAAGDKDVCPMPAALARRDDCTMSFSGLKTAARRLAASDARPENIAAAFQEAAISMIVRKTRRALTLTRHQRLAVVGGVAQNRAVQASLTMLAGEQGVSIYFPPAHWCTDNAAMIALTGLHRLRDDYSATIRPRWALNEIA